jgi:hypothetical protein
VLVHARPPPLLAVEPRIAYAAQASDEGRSLRVAARRLARLAADVGIARTTTVHVGYGDLGERLRAIARRENAALILIGSHASAMSGTSGSLAPRLIEQANCPVVALPSSGVPGDSIVCGVDGSPGASRRARSCRTPLPAARCAPGGRERRANACHDPGSDRRCVS